MALLANQIWQCLDLDLLDGAELLAEQLVAQEDTADTRYLLGFVLHRRHQPTSVQLLTQQHHRTHVGCAWLYASACLALHQYEDGATALSQSRSLWALGNDLSLGTQYGRGELSPAAFHLLLARLYEHHRPGAANDEYIESTKLNPYLMENVLALCRSTTAEVKGKHMFSRFANNPFETEPALTANNFAGSTNFAGAPDSGVTGTSVANQGANGHGRQANPHNITSLPEDEALAPHSTALPTISGASVFGGATLAQQASTSTPRRMGTPQRALTTPMTFSPAGTNPRFTLNTPALQTPSSQINSTLGHPPPQGPTTGFGGGPSAAFGAPFGASASGFGPSATGFAAPTAGFGGAAGFTGPPRERFPSLSFRRGDQSSLQSLGRGLFGDAGNLGNHSTTLGLNWGGSRTPNPGSSQSGAGNTGVASLTGVAALETLVDALELLSQCEFTAALASLASLATPIQQTPFVLALKGKLLLEQGKNDACVDVFTKLRKLQPDRVRGTELLSTALWHLKQDAPLALLGFELTHHQARTRRCWQSWCVLGNAFSLRHDTTNAIKCFRRALQIEDTAYAWTLLGYEYMVSDELENALEAFSSALKTSPQHYNAWYGLGSAYYSLGDAKEAEIYFAQAIRLNPNNAVLYCFMGAVLAERGQVQQAMTQYDRACSLDPHSAMPRFRKAEMLVSVGMDREALKLLLEVEQLAPEDASIQMTLARVYKKLGEGERAVQVFTKAHQLAPKSSSRIRKELELV